jgi:serine/threonine protein kinase
MVLALPFGYNPVQFLYVSPEHPHPMAPQVFAGKYVVQEEVARGGMGVIYRALDRTLNRVVAIKLVHAHLSGDASFAERFLREARAMARLQHEHIVSIYAVEEDGGTQFLVMEFCPGRNLREIIRKQPARSVRDVVRLAQQLASALAYAHAQGVIHRDIKPANVLVDKQGKAKLTDFGIAAALDEAALTSAGQVIGTPEYMSPEQARGLKLDGRSDLFSLGIVMYEMLTGRTPYAESSGTSILGKLVSDREELTLQFPSHVPPVVRGVVQDLLRRDRDNRFSDAETLANQLPEILYTVPETPPPTVPDEPDRTMISTTSPIHTEERPRFTSPSAPTVIAPSAGRGYQDETVFAAAPAIHPDSRKSPQAEERTPVRPPQPQTASTYKVSQPTVSPPPPAPTGSPIKSLMVGGLLLVVALIGLVSYLGSRPDNRPADAVRPVPQPETNPPSPPPSDQKAALLEARLKDRENHLTKLETLLSSTVDPLQLGKQATDCSELKALATETYGKYEDAVREVNRVRRELEQEPVTPISRPAHLDMKCPSGKPSSIALKPTSPPAPPAAVKPTSELTPSVTASKPELSTPKGEIHSGSAAITSGSDPEPKPDVPAVSPAKPELKPEPPSPAPPAQVATGFPDAQLRSLLDRFTHAYERRDVDTLRAISRMGEARQRNIDTMFHSYETFKLSITSVTPHENGAAAVIIIDTAMTATGETVDLSPIAKKINLRISRQGEAWDKIVW